MSLVEQVAADARAELIYSLANVVGSIEQLQSRAAAATARGNDETADIQDLNNPKTTVLDTKIRHDGTQYIQKFVSEGNAIHLNCTRDVQDLLNHLFKENELIKIGITSTRIIQTQTTRRRTRTTETTDANQSYELYLLRPTFEDAALLKTALCYDRNDCFVICLPDISDMFPDMLQGVLGKGFTVSRGITKQAGNRVVHLYSCNVHMAPVESCALSMFLPQSFEAFYAHSDPAASWFFARALEHLESRIFDGVVHRVTCLGHLSRYSGEILLKSRRDCAAELIITGTQRSYGASDMPFLTRELKKRTQGETQGAEEFSNSTSTTQTTATGRDTGNIDHRMRLMRQSNIVDEAVLIDRRVDMVTPMCLNFTYEGLIDNLLGVVHGHVRVPSGVIEGSAGAASDILDQYRTTFSQNTNSENRVPTVDSTVLPLNSMLYRELRCLNYSEVGKHLHQRALQVHKGYERGDLTTLDEMDAFVKKFKSLQQEHSELSVHVNLMSWLSSIANSDSRQLLHQLEDSILQSTTDVKLEDSKLASITAKLFNKPCDPCVALFLDLIFWNVEVQQIYRLLVLLSQTRDGVKSSDLNSIKRAIVDQYGFDQLLVLQKVEQMGLLRINDTPDGLRWSRLCKKLNLLVDRDTGAADYAWIFGGYAPISIRLFQLIVLANNVSSLQQEFRLLNCPVSVLRQKNDLPSNARNKASAKLLGFLGGVTLGEIAAVASLNQKRGEQTILLTTNVVNMRSIFKDGS
ncbi:Vacuolar protein-sorting-associated protein 33 -like protein [Babesia sp. Xinjiang]|uniref:Vacuolar protein-sorting-associated protein 33 -like protein n=1 Tax=Babesia sp. Xinjiang TaxID=462227 RepID=UPI000A21F263|nr:Vacuolar protein-sorting-associated protein 33 -like protein [Babesia sp. Xinjiang]ORM39923.1 Vacuolar protein-sorting-associated protein 33 -like protein [Babesia sp. Xinjiang]